MLSALIHSSLSLNYTGSNYAGLGDLFIQIGQ